MTRRVRRWRVRCRQRAQTQGETVLIVPQLLQEKARHGLEDRLVRAGCETATCQGQSLSTRALRSVHQVELPEGNTVRGVLCHELIQDGLGCGPIVACQGVNGLHVQVLALCVHTVLQRHGLLMRCHDGVNLPHAEGNVGPCTVRQGELRINGRCARERLHRTTAPA